MKYLSCIIVCLFIVGCVTTRVNTDYQIGDPKTVTIGSAMISTSYVNLGQFTGNIWGFREDLYYNGLDHNVILVGYQEFDITENGDYIRPAFAQNLRYDMALSDTIMFRTVKIKVHSFDARIINFTVLEAPGTTRNNRRYLKKE